MIGRERPNTLLLLFAVRGTVPPAVLPQLAVVFAAAAAVTRFHGMRPEALRALLPTPFTLVDIARSVFLGFRDSACFEQWWEARRQWGTRLAKVQGAVQNIAALLPEDAAARRRLGRGLGGFARALR